MSTKMYVVIGPYDKVYGAWACKAEASTRMFRLASSMAGKTFKLLEAELLSTMLVAHGPVGVPPQVTKH